MGERINDCKVNIKANDVKNRYSERKENPEWTKDTTGRVNVDSLEEEEETQLKV